MRGSSIRRTVADADSSCGDSGISGAASGCASPTQTGGGSGSGVPGCRQPFLPLLGADDSVGWQLPTMMAMSAISELPSTSPTSSPTAAAIGSTPGFERGAVTNNLVTQSLSYGKGPSAQARRQALAHSLAMLGHETRSRSRELDRRERELQDATAKATEQIEYVLKVTEKTHKLEDENQQLRRQVELYKDEIGKLLDELQERETELQERDEDLARRDEYCEELRRELGRTRQDCAQIRTRADQLKVENSVLSSSRVAEVEYGGRCSRPAAECEEARRFTQRLQRQLAQAETEARRAASEASIQGSRAEELEEECRRLADEQGSDERSKRELLQTIRRLAEDKMVWEAYCARLLRRAVECAPQLLCCQQQQAAAAASSTPEGRWESLFTVLFKTVMQSEPRLAECVTGRLPQQMQQQLLQPRQPQLSPSTIGPQLARRTPTSAAAATAATGTVRPILPPAMRAARPATAVAAGSTV